MFTIALSPLAHGRIGDTQTPGHGRAGNAFGAGQHNLGPQHQTMRQGSGAGRLPSSDSSLSLRVRGVTGRPRGMGIPPEAKGCPLIYRYFRDSTLVESFNGKFRDACLNEHWFLDLADARRTIEAWRVHYNTVRPHSSLGFLTPERFRAAGDKCCGKAGPSGTLENSSSFPLSHSLDGGDNSPNSSLWSRT